MFTRSHLLKRKTPILEKNGLQIGTINDGFATIRFDATRLPTCFESGSVPISSYVNLSLKRSKVYLIVITDRASGLTNSARFSAFQYPRREIKLRSGKYCLAVCTSVASDSDGNWGSSHE